MLAVSVTGPRAWQAKTVDDRRSWYWAIPDACLSAFEGAFGPGQEITSLTLAPETRAACARAFHPVRDALENGRGFVILEAPSRPYSADQFQRLYWLTGLALGRPVVQNVQGALFYDVRDTGQDVRYGARFSVTNAATGFHTDNSFGDEIVDWVGLLCLKAARAGGINQLVSGMAVYHAMQSRCPDALEALSRPFHVERRGGLRVGDGPTVLYPVVAGPAEDQTWRYLRYWIEAGHKTAGEPLTPAQRRALDALDEVAGDPALRVEFGLRPGEVLLVNNRWILHNRTAFEDHAEPELRRHYVRLWLKRT